MQRVNDAPNIEELLAKAKKPSADAMKLHPFYRGKIETVLKCVLRSLTTSPSGTRRAWRPPAGPSRPSELVYEYTNKWNTVAVVSDGTRVLGLGDIGPKAGLPVMEGKALLFKYLGGVDARAHLLDTKDPDEIINTVMLLPALFRRDQPGRHLAAQVLPHPGHAAREKAEIPVWHDDQQGTATVILAGLINALKIVGKKHGRRAHRLHRLGRGQRRHRPALLHGRGVEPGQV